MSKKDEMKQVYNELVNFKKSSLCIERIENGTFPVVGEGDLDARIMFIGEAPGKKESETGKPFCGSSGKILDNLLDHIGLSREKVYITNIVKDRPTDNRDPKPEEIELYAPFLDRQINIIKPSVLATLGRFSTEYIMNRYDLGNSYDSISKIHGNLFETISGDGKINIIPLYHPAVAVYNRKKLPELKKDFEILKNFL